MIRPICLYRFWCIALLIAFSSCSDVEQYPVGPGPLETPERISDASLIYEPSTNYVVLTWTVPRFSDDAARLIRYEIRYVYDSEFDWTKALSVLNPPVPIQSGRKQYYHFENPEQGGVLKVAVVAIDDADKMSAPSNVAALHVPGLMFSGRVIGVLSQQPVPGIELAFTGSTVSDKVTTDANGEFELNDLRPQLITISFEDISGQPQYFGLIKEDPVLTDTYQQVVLIPYRMSELYPSVSILKLLKQACRTQLSPYTLIRKWENLPMPIYIPEYVNEYGIDYKQTAIDAVNCWMNLTGIAMWEFVDEPQSWGVEMFFKPKAEMGIQLGYTSHKHTPEGLPLRSDISLLNSYTSQMGIYIVILHELGHTIRLRHLPSGFLMFASHPLPDAPTNDEILIVQILNNLPNWTDMSIYQEVTP